MNNKNYRVMKFFEPVNKQDKSRGYVRLDIRGVKGNIIVSVENLGEVKTTSEVYLYKDKKNKIKLGEINNKKGTLKKLLTFGNNNAIEDYNICAVVNDKKIIMYSNLFNTTSLEQVRKLEADEEKNIIEEVSNLEDTSVLENTPKSAGEIETVEELKNENKTDETVQEAKINDNVKLSVSSAVNINEPPVEQENNEEPIDDEQAQAQAQFHKYKNKFDESLYNVLKDYKEVEPLSVKIKDFYWWYIPFDETGIKNGFLPYYNQIISSYYPYPMSNRVTTCSGLMKKYGHYIFGVYKERGDIAKFIYGVPGDFVKEEQPYKGITGFKNWSYSNKENYDKHGYWLAFVNPKTGETTEPPQIVLS